MQDQPLSEGGKLLLKTIKDELLPTIDCLKDILISMQRIRISNYLRSSDLKDLEKRYMETTKVFFEIVRKLQTPDILFLGLKKEDSFDARNLVEYFQFQQAFKENINEGVKYIEIIDRSLDRKIQGMRENRTLLISIIAIVLSVLSLGS